MDKIFVDEAVNELVTIQDVLRWAVSRFNDAQIFLGHGTDSAWDEAVALITHSLHLPGDIGHEVLTAKLTRSERQRVIDLIMTRIQQRMPLPYLTNKAWFAGLPFFVDERVLIPRSPVAELIEQEFAPWLLKQPQRILDLCTGSGCIAVALAYAFPEAEVDALDISADALAVAEININEHALNERVYPILSDCFDGVPGVQYDLIVSNPPYVDAEDMDDLPEEFRHEPELALAAGNDGLDLVRRMLREAPEHLTDNGLLVCEVGNSQVHMAQAFPDVPFVWLELENGGHGIFAIDRNALLTHASVFA